MNDDGRVSFDSAPDTVDWYYPPIIAMMKSQALMWYPPNRSADDIPPVAEADAHLGRINQTWQKVKAELDRIAVDEQPHADTPPQPRGDIPPDEKRDKGMWLLLRMAADYLSLSGRPHGADLLKHWLNNSGTTQYVNPADIRRDDTGWQPTDVLDETTRPRATTGGMRSITFDTGSPAGR